MKYNNTAVIVADMQNSFAKQGGDLYTPSTGEIVEDVEEFTQKMREEGASIIFTQDTHTEEQFEEEMEFYDEFSRWGEHALEGTEGHELAEELTVKTSDTVIQKKTYDAFEETELQGELEEQEIDNVVIVGTFANTAVLHTASSAALNDYNTIVAEDLVGYVEESDKEYALEHIDRTLGEVTESEKVEDYFEPPQGPSSGQNQSSGQQSQQRQSQPKSEREQPATTREAKSRYE